MHLCDTSSKCFLNLCETLNAMSNKVQLDLNYDNFSHDNIVAIGQLRARISSFESDTMILMAFILTLSACIATSLFITSSDLANVLACASQHGTYIFLEEDSPKANLLNTPATPQMSSEEEVYGFNSNHFVTISTPVINNYETPVLSPSQVNDATNNLIPLGTPIINNFETPVVSPAPAIETSRSNSFPSDDNISDANTSTSQLLNADDSGGFWPSLSDSQMSSEASGEDNLDDITKLKNIRLSNVNRLVIGQLNINSLRNKFEALIDIVRDNLDILVLTETKLDKTFPQNQFFINGFSTPFRLDRNGHGGGVIIYVREDIPCKILKCHKTSANFEGILLEVNLRRRKWLLFGGYNPNKGNISNFVNQLGLTLDEYMHAYDNFIILGDFNAEISEPIMDEFCAVYGLKNLIKVPTCFKNPLNPSSIDVILTNKVRSFQNSVTIETGLSDHHKMTITVLKQFFAKQHPLTIRYRDYKNLDLNRFRGDLIEALGNFQHPIMSYESFEDLFVRLLGKHAPLKVKYIRANNASFMNKTLSKSFMTRSRLRNKFLKNPTLDNERNYKKFRNFCTNLVRKEKRNFFSNLDTHLVTDNKKFWKTVKPLFSDKDFTSRKITLLDGDKIITSEKEVAKTFNLFFSKAVENLDIKGFVTEDFVYDVQCSPVSNIIRKFSNHPSINKIKEVVKVDELFHFSSSNEGNISAKIASLNTKKPTTVNNIPAKLLVETSDIISPVLTRIINDSKLHSNFPNNLKLADLAPIHKKEETTAKNNYRAVSILPSVSKIFERDMEEQFFSYVEKFLSPYLCGFRKGFSTQHCLMVMLEVWKVALDKGKAAGAILTDLSKAFDCINHELLIAKLEAYGFDHASLTYVHSYLSDRKQRTKINNCLSSWSDIKSGVPQGSILGPLLFNIYLNDIFYFTDKTSITNYADDTTPYAVANDTVELLNILEKDVEILTYWFEINYFKLNADKCHLLVSNHDEDASIIVNNKIVEGNKSVKLLGIKIDNELKFTEHVENICNKISQKLHALARVANFMNTDKLRVLLKAFIESQFQYCPLVWMFHSRTLNNRINRLHERALRLAYKEPYFTFEELLVKDKSFTVHHRNLQTLAIEMYKFHNNLSPEIMKCIFQESSNPYNLRNKNPFKGRNVRTVRYGTETISFRGPKIWALVPTEIKASASLEEFKSKIKDWKPLGCTCRLCKNYVYNIGFL